MKYCTVCGKYHEDTTGGCFVSKHEYQFPSEAEMTMASFASLVTQSPLPESFGELGDLLWKAFNFGKQYRDFGGEG